eukprot:CAMPEP_0171112878 /NCGR_PEP_ID=MMETSP0766_2-20121228/80581_1 /TAXON_ID=439317 /ORGANISM="Gambierdiscus australes, Strain CAWD 149" /LENGTH=105 /DNA_ID=CAMNT_0011575039 /DNA_START=30 /DNA_END=347 /DNA_ORIENTATION=+
MPQDGPLNTDSDQQLLNRINGGSYRVGAVPDATNGAAPAGAQQPPSQQPASQQPPHSEQAPPGAAGPHAEAAHTEPAQDLAQLRGQRLAHFEQRPPEPQGGTSAS